MLLAVCLTSCAERIPTPPVPIILLPPESVFKPCEVPTLQGDTWGDIGSHALALQTALSICAGQVATLNQWREVAGRKQ
ncbi:Rz1-like lysis system protein LysC [Serratia sp. CY76391]|uniref:Rz1-like lysis system protein LysC n=1 Tax=Serratia sp. CY76391 TaxID=3383681 RepID=UPI003F9EE30E